MRKLNYSLLALIAAFFITAVISGPVLAQGVPWRDHQAPYDFLFRNHIDTHIQLKTVPDGSLFGFFYIVFTDEFTPDGTPIARHYNPGDDPSEASVGWTVKAVPGIATVAYHQMGDHPLWLVPARDDIPQPGGYSHFHWEKGPMHAMELKVGDTYEGYYLELTAKDTFAFRHGGDLVYVSNGLDLATHTNIVTVFPGLTDGGSGGGHGGDDGGH